jgi:uncharacterized protein YjlB
MTRPEMHRFEDAGGIPNSRLSVLVYHNVENAHAPREFEELFARNLDAYRHRFAYAAAEHTRNTNVRTDTLAA